MLELNRSVVATQSWPHDSSVSVQWFPVKKQTNKKKMDASPGHPLSL